jgi:hypothetical protein
MEVEMLTFAIRFTTIYFAAIPVIDWGSIISQFASLVGFAAFVAAIVNSLKTLGVIRDGDAPKWVAGFNAIGIIALLALRIFKPEMDIQMLDTQAAGIAAFLLVLVGFVAQIGISQWVHNILKGIPVIGKSFTLDAQKAILPKPDNDLVK